MTTSNSSLSAAGLMGDKAHIAHLLLKVAVKHPLLPRQNCILHVRSDLPAGDGQWGTVGGRR